MAVYLSSMLVETLSCSTFYITKSGDLDHSKTSQDGVVEFSSELKAGNTAFPVDVTNYIRDRGLWSMVKKTEASDFLAKFKRLQDGEEIEVREFLLLIYASNGSREEFEKIGFRSDMNGVIYGCYLRLDDLVRLASFLHDAGANIVLDFPPWFNDSLLALLVEKIKPSSRRPGPEDARFFGLG